jgi:hypothetical protein
MTLNGVSFVPGVALAPGTLFGNVDLATALNQWCPLQRKIIPVADQHPGPLGLT